MELELTEKSVKDYLEKNYNESDLEQEVDEAKSDFLDDDWEDEFEDEEEAYIETGRGEAEGQVRQEIENHILGKLGIDYWEFEKKIGRTISDIIHDVYPFLDQD